MTGVIQEVHEPSRGVGRVSTTEIALFFRRLHSMMASGISLPDSLAYLEKGEAKPACRELVAGCLDNLLKGYPLSTGMKRFPGVFPPVFLEMVHSGETTGTLSSTLGDIAVLCERQLERSRRLLSALAYPLCLFVVMVLVVLLFVFFVAPGDEGLLSTIEGDVPWPSQVLMAFSRFVTNPFSLIGSLLLIGGAVVAFGKAYREQFEFRLWVDSFCLGLPIVGRLLILLDSARALEVIASSLKVGLNIGEALQTASRVVSNEKFRQDLRATYQAITEGNGLGRSLAGLTPIPRFATSLIEVAEEAGELDLVLDRTAASLDEDANDALDKVAALAEPILLTFGGIAAGFVAVATFLPIMRLLSHL